MRSATSPMRSASGRFMQSGEAERIVGSDRILEGERADEHAAVDLRQHHMHGEIRRAKPARALDPAVAFGGGDDRLQHRSVGRIERRCFAFAGSGERRRGDDHRGLEARQPLGKRCARVLVLQARDEERRRRKPALGERGAQRIDRCDIGRKQHRAIEEDRHDRLAAGERRFQVFECNDALAWQIACDTRHGLRRRTCRVVPAWRASWRKQRPQVFASAFAERTRAASQARPPAMSMPPQAADRRDPRRAAPRARCLFLWRRPPAPRRRSATSRARRAGAPR